MPGSIFKAVYLIEFVVIAVVRQVYTSRYRRLSTRSNRTQAVDLALLGLIGVAMLVPLVYIFTGVLDFADYLLPDWTGWLGAVLFAGAIWLLWRSHADLGKNWTPTPALRDDHTLITNGVYRYIRHPMYAAHFLWGIGQAMMLHNWIAGPSLIVLMIPQYLLRVGAEEKMMVEAFGRSYVDYMQHTGRMIPRLGRSSERS